MFSSLQWLFSPLIFLTEIRKNVIMKQILCDEFIWEIWLISETWLDCSKLTYNTCNSTNKGSKNWSITFKGHKAVLLKAILAKTSNFWPIGPIELKFWHLILKMIHFKISLRQSHESSFRPLWWLWAPYLGLFWLIFQIWLNSMKFSCIFTAVVQKKSHRWRFEATHLCFSNVMRPKRGFCCKWGRAFCSWWVWWSFPP